MAIDMGLGELAAQDTIFKRKFRWTLQLQMCSGVIPEFQVKVASRPSLTIEETEINFLNGKMWIPGKGSWETMTVTFYDLAGSNNGIKNLYNWLAGVYNFTDPVGLRQSSKRGTVFGNGIGQAGYAGEAILTSYDGCGTELEQWTLGHCWPQAVNFGELDYSSSEEMTIEVTLRYSEAKFRNICGGDIRPCDCVGC